MKPDLSKKDVNIDQTRHNPQRRDLVKSDIIEAFDYRHILLKYQELKIGKKEGP